ncbi:MAG: hypothetical protein GVY12_01030 [Bacteroidetes bacterium]|jgi:hypothetical protein|nr:hypothetical protein [Bacteroidota bacterium]
MSTTKSLQRRRDQLADIEQHLADLPELPDDTKELVKQSHERASLRETADALQAEIDRLEAQRKAEQERIRKERARVRVVDAIEEGTKAMHAMGEAMEAAAKEAMPHLEEARKAYKQWEATGRRAYDAARDHTPGVAYSNRHTTEQVDAGNAFLKELEAEGLNWRVALQHIGSRYLHTFISDSPMPKAAIGTPMYQVLWTALVHNWTNLHRAYEEAQANAGDEGLGDDTDVLADAQPTTA